VSFLILQGDALHIPLADESVQCAPTSPPYFGLRNYGLPPTDWPEVEYAPMPGLPPLTIPAMTCCLGLEETPEAYTGHLVAVFREVNRVLRKDGTVWLNLGDSYATTPPGNKGFHYGPGRQAQGVLQTGHANRDWHGLGLKPKDLVGIPWRVAFALQADGWWLRSDIVWAKGISFCDTYSGSTMPESVTDRPTKAHEDIFLLAKSERYFYDHEAVKEAAATGWNGSSFTDERDAITKPGLGRGPRTETATRNLRDVWAISPTPYKAAHFATFSPSLVEPMIKAGSSEKGACPRCGAPWELVVERESERHNAGAAKQRIVASGGALDGGTERSTLGGMTRFVQREEVGWQPTCDCPEHTPVPCIVLHPFSGAGTTVLVADRLGRNGVGLDLSGTYTRMGRDRVFNDAPLLALMGAIA